MRFRDLAEDLGKKISKFAISPWVVPLLMIAGAFERILWAVIRSGTGATGEAANVAVSVAQNGVFGAPFDPAQGATAHLMPTTPLIAGGIYHLFGIRTVPSETILTVWSIGLVLGSFYFLFKTFEALGTPIIARLMALAILTLIPVYTGQEAVDFRIWDGGLTVFLASYFIYEMVRTDKVEVVAIKTIWKIAFLTAIIFFVSPSVGLAAYSIAGIFFLARFSWQRIFGSMCISLVCLTIAFTPWAVRNYQVMGEPIVLRSNFGLELAIANHEAAVLASNPRETFVARLKAIHPAAGAYERLQGAGGEVAYARKLGIETKLWISENPRDFVTLCAQHLVQFFFPRPWQFEMTGKTEFSLLRSMVASFIGLVGVFGALWGLSSSDRRRWYLTIMGLIPGMSFMLFQPVLRYNYVAYGIMVFLTLDALTRLLGRYNRTKPRTNRQSPV